MVRRFAFLTFALVPLLAGGCGKSRDKTLDDFLPEIPSPTGEPQSVFAGEIVPDNAFELVDGPAQTGMVGDFFIRNSRGRFVIQAATRVIGVVPQGGNVIDAVPVGPDGDLAEDQFGELSFMYLLGRTCEHDRIDVVQDGSGGGAAAIVARGLAAPNDFINIKGMGLLPVRTDLDPDIPDSVECATTYILYPDSPTLHVLWTLYNPGETRIQGPFAAFSNVGGENQSFSPALGFERLGIDSLAGVAEPAPVDYAVYQSPGVAYGVIPRHEGENSAFLIAGVSVILFGSDELLDILNDDAFHLDLPGGDGVTNALDFVVGRHAADVEEAFLAGLGAETGELSGTVTLAGGGPAAGARVGLFTDMNGNGSIDADDRIVTYVDVDETGAYAVRVRPGSYLLRADLLSQGRSPAVAVDVGAAGAAAPTLVVPQPVVFDYTIVDDESGEIIPGKLTVVGRNPAAVDPRIHPNFDAARGVVTMAHSLYGTTTDVGDGADPPLVLPPGSDYRVIASRGTEWSFDSVLLSPASGDPAGDLEFRLRRTAPADGYISSEYHVHSLGSPDSHVSQVVRVASAVSEGIELFATTDHDFVENLQPVIESLAVESRVRSIVGLEVTPFPYGHFNAWPVQQDFDSPNFGAVDWARGVDGFAMIPSEIFSTLRARGADLIQVNHPRASRGSVVDFMAHFDRAGLAFDYEARAISGDLLTQPVPNEFLRLPPEVNMFDPSFNALEVWNGFAMADTNGDGVREIVRLDQVMRDWFNFLSFGLEVTPLGNSDTHTSVKDPLGMPRTYVRVADDSPAALSSGAVIDDVIDTLAGRNGTPRDVIVTNGPFITVEVDGEPDPLGRVVDGSSGVIDVTITVIAADWAEFDTIEIFANETPAVGVNVSALQPLACFTSRDPAGLAENDPCALAPFGGAREMDVDSVSVGGGHNRFEATVSLSIAATDVLTREGAVGSDAWFVIRVRGGRAIYPLLLENIIGESIIDTLVSGTAEAIDAALRGIGVPATAFTAPFYVDFDGDGVYRAPFSPQ